MIYLVESTVACRCGYVGQVDAVVTVKQEPASAICPKCNRTIEIPLNPPF